MGKGQSEWWDPAGIFGQPDMPTPPDPNVIGEAQTASNVETALANAALGNVNQNTPWGNVSYTSTPGSVTVGGQNIPQWTQTTTLSPEQQQLNDLQQQQSLLLGQLGIDQTNSVSNILGTRYNPQRFNTNAVTGGPLDIEGELGDASGDIEARYREMAQRGLGEDFDRREESLRSRLANQGINAGTEAFGSELEGLGEQRGDAFARAELMARGQAQADRGQALSELTGERGTNLGEALQQYNLDTTADLAERQNPLNEIIALMSGNQTNPINPGQPGGSAGIGGTNLAGIAQNAFGQQMQGYQSQQSSNNALLAALASAAAMMWSDRRLKRDVQYWRTDDRGNRWYRFHYLDDPPDAPWREGVMADEVPAHARKFTPSGHWAVDYGAL